MSDAPAAHPTRRDTAWFALALLALVGILIFLTDGGILFTRPFWVDEWLTVYIAHRPTPFHVLGDLNAGTDGGSSLFHLTMWVARALTGALNPPLVRGLALASVCGALVLAFAVLRRSFTRSSAALGALAAGSSVLVVAHSFEGRFYGPWLLLAAATAWLLSRHQVRRDRTSAASLAVAGVLLCTVHFYGIISLGLMLVAVVTSHGARWREALPLVRPAFAGALGLVVVIPLAFAQRRAYTVPSWLPDFQPQQAAYMATEFWLSRVPVLAALIMVILFLVRAGGASHTLAPPVRAARSDAGIMALLGLAVMPLALMVLSVLGQPSMLSRYAIVTTLAWAPLMAVAASMGGRAVRGVLALLLAWFWFGSYTRVVIEKTGYAGVVHRWRDTFAQASQSGLPIVFQSIHVMYPVMEMRWAGETRVAFLELSDSTLGALFHDSTRVGQLNRGIVLERDLARAESRRWNFPVLAPAERLRTLDRFLLMAPPERLPAGVPGVDYLARGLFPSHRPTRLTEDLWVLEATSGGPSSK